FHSTPWSLILRTQESNPGEAQAALATLCEHYWYPLYVFVRRKLGDVEQALDATQGFFTHLIESDLVGAAHPARGRFRTFLLTCCENYLRNERRREQALKRGGGRRIVSLDVDEFEDRYQREPADPVTPEMLYDRRWAMTLLQDAFAILRQEYEDA